jgi:cellulose synthase/poly-beta-1,6-N-acetylglucosamine synthase-like glycosyltransferase
MLVWLAIIVSLALLLLLVANFPAVAWFWWRLRRPAVPRAEDRLPKVAVVLCLRGADPTLERCLEGLLTQDYPYYVVVIIVDHPSDPAWEIAQASVQQHPHVPVRVEPLRVAADSCSLKCSSLIQAISALDDSFEVVALLDADTVPAGDWLRELVTPFADPKIGATTGVRWFMPSPATWASVGRYHWGAAATVACHTLGIAWGGTLAIRRDVFRRQQLLEKWSKAYCEDTMTRSILKPLGLRLKMVPTLVQVNHEPCTLRGFFSWCVRQVLTTRLYHSAWWVILGHGLVSVFSFVVPILLMIWALWRQEWRSAGWLGLSVLVYWLVLWIELLAVEAGVRQAVRRRGQRASWLTPTALVKSFLAIPFTQLVYGGVLAAACTVRRICWRGIWYEIDGPWKVKMRSYRPHAAATAGAASPNSSPQQLDGLGAAQG